MTTSSFEGFVGRISGSVSGPAQPRHGTDCRRRVDPRPRRQRPGQLDGPGIGVESLANVLSAGLVAGIDPSAAMNESARRRNQAGDRVRSYQAPAIAGAEAIPWLRNNTSGGIVAVNSAQLWRPLDTAVREVARVTRPGGSLVIITHAWAIEKTSPVPEWIERMSSLLEERGWLAISSRFKKFRSGRGLIFRATTLGGEVAGHDP